MCLRIINFYLNSQFKSVDIFKRLFALIGENGQGIGTSSFADWVQNVSKLELPVDEKLAAEELIDSCYAQLEEGKQLMQTEILLEMCARLCLQSN